MSSGFCRMKKRIIYTIILNPRNGWCPTSLTSPRIGKVSFVLRDCNAEERKQNRMKRVLTSQSLLGINIVLCTRSLLITYYTVSAFYITTTRIFLKWTRLIQYCIKSELCRTNSRRSARIKFPFSPPYIVGRKGENWQRYQSRQQTSTCISVIGTQEHAGDTTPISTQQLRVETLCQ